MSFFKLLFKLQGLDQPVAAFGNVADPLHPDDDIGISLAELLRRSPSHDQVHIVDTGAQARELALKLTRRWGQRHRHGAVGVISTCASEQGSTTVPSNNLAALHAAVDAYTVAIVLEPVSCANADLQATREYFQGAAQLCRELKILLILDETETHLGRRKTLLCEELCGVRADIVVLGGVIEGGRPVAAVLARGSSSSGQGLSAAAPVNWGAVAA